jgi:tRNA(Arg) A34 adenosine deaminase TadA
MTAAAQDIELLRTAIEVAVRARSNGNHPFGSLLTDADGRVVLEAENTVVTSRDVTAHAETNLVRAASARWSAAELGAFSLYTSCEPCAMCSGAIYWSGIGRVVYALAETGLLALTGGEEGSTMLALPSRVVLGSGRRPIDVVGPEIEDEGLVPHLGFWAELG